MSTFRITFMLSLHNEQSFERKPTLVVIDVSQSRGSLLTTSYSNYGNERQYGVWLLLARSVYLMGFHLRRFEELRLYNLFIK